MKNLQLVILVFTTLFFSKVNGQEKLFEINSNKPVLKHQILLTNYAKFKDHKDEMYGASAFLINYRNKVYAVTAKHVLGDAMGVVPEIKIKDFNTSLIRWQMFPRVSINPKLDTVEIGKLKLNYDSLNKDILLLEVTNTKFNTLPLNPSFTLPIKGEKLYIIGCPYSQENCKQNVYEIFFDSFYDETSSLIFTIKTKFELAGFSGAPIVNASGNVVGILTTGWDDEGKKYVGGTFIKELEKIK